MAMYDGTASNERTTGLSVNPMLKKLAKINETSEDYATYGGIFRKCVFFMVMVAAGIILAVVLNGMSPVTYVADNGYTFSLSAPAAIAALIALGLMLITPLLAFLIRPILPIAGSLSCMSIGYVLMLMCLLGGEEYGSIVLLALVFTVAIVFAMAILYKNGVIRATRKFRTVLMTLVLSSLFGSLLIFICWFVPGLRIIVAALLNNMVVYVVSAIVGIIIAALFLISDFETVRSTVEGRLPKKYEWYAAYGLVYTIIWLYMKILSLLARLKDRK